MANIQLTAFYSGYMEKKAALANELGGALGMAVAAKGAQQAGRLTDAGKDEDSSAKKNMGRALGVLGTGAAGAAGGYMGNAVQYPEGVSKGITALKGVPEDVKTLFTSAEKGKKISDVLEYLKGNVGTLGRLNKGMLAGAGAGSTFAALAYLLSKIGQTPKESTKTVPGNI